MWFFFGVRHADADEIVADTPSEVVADRRSTQPDRSPTRARAGECIPFGLRPGDVERTQVQSYVRDVMLRLTTQLTAAQQVRDLLQSRLEGQRQRVRLRHRSGVRVQRARQQGRALSVGIREMDLDDEQPGAARGGLGLERVRQDHRPEALQRSALSARQRAGEPGMDRQRAAHGQRAEQESVLHAARRLHASGGRAARTTSRSTPAIPSRHRRPTSPVRTTSRAGSRGRSDRTGST